MSSVKMRRLNAFYGALPFNGAPGFRVVWSLILTGSSVLVDLLSFAPKIQTK